MIWNLAIQQARATARYTRAAAIFMTMGVATLTLAVGVASTQQRIESDANDIATGGLPHVERVSTLFGPDTPGGPASPVVAQDVPRDFPITTIAESDAWVSRALTAGSPVTAWRETLLRPLVRNDGDSFAQGVAATGEFDWEAALVEGEAPEPGEVVLSISAARVFDVGIGDAVTFTRASNLHGEAPPIPAFTVSGLSRSAVEGDSTFYSFAPDAYFNWADSSTVTGPFAQYVRASSSPDATSNDEPFIAAPETSLAWSGDSSTFPELAELGSRTDYEPWSDGAWFYWLPGSSVATWALLGCFVAGAGVLAMAFALGRSQARARSSWVGTARAMGATRRDVVAASLLEAGFIAGIVFVVGGGLGLLATNGLLAAARATVDTPALPRFASIPWQAGLEVAVFAALLALIVAAVPVLAAARTQPADALKPAGEAPEPRTASRAVRRVLPWIAGASAVLGIVAYGLMDAVSLKLWVVTATIAAFGLALSTLIGAKEMLRLAIAKSGERMARSRRPWLMAAGDALNDRPRQGLPAALLFGLSAGLMLFVTSADVLARQEDRWWSAPGDGPDLYVVTGIGAFALLVATLLFEAIAVAVHLADRAATRRSLATRQALGLSVNDAKLGAAVQHLVPHLLGMFLLGAIGSAAGVLIHFTTQLTWDQAHRGTFPDYLPAFGVCVLIAAVVVGVGTLVAVLGSVFVSASVRAESPVAALADRR